MPDLDTKMKIEILLDFAYDKTVERMNAIEGESYPNIAQSLVLIKNNKVSYELAYLHYYLGCLEGILFTRFLEEFNRMPTPSENSFILEISRQKYEDLKDMVISLTEKKFNEHCVSYQLNNKK